MLAGARQALEEDPDPEPNFAMPRLRKDWQKEGQFDPLGTNTRCWTILAIHHRNRTINRLLLTAALMMCALVLCCDAVCSDGGCYDGGCSDGGCSDGGCSGAVGALVLCALMLCALILCALVLAALVLCAMMLCDDSGGRVTSQEGLWGVIVTMGVAAMRVSCVLL